MLAVAVMAGAAPAAADPGSVDRAFGRAGLVVGGDDFAPLTAGAAFDLSDLEPQPDGKLVLLAGSTVQRRLPSGALDRTFGQGGAVQLGGRGFFVAADLAVVPDGGIVVAGRSMGDAVEPRRGLTVVVLRPDGGPDTAFGPDGKRIIEDDGGPYEARTVAVDPSGRIVVAGSISAATSEAFLGFVARFLRSGRLDPSFHRDGLRRDDVIGYVQVFLQGSRPVVAGNSKEGGQLVVRLTDSGDLDPDFGSGGRVALEGDSTILAPGPSGGFVGVRCSPTGIRVLRYDADGRLDESSRRSTEVPCRDTFGFDVEVAVAPDGAVLISANGASNVPVNFGLSEPIIYRIGPDGSLDARFGCRGRTFLDTGERQRVITALLVEPEGSVIVGGGPAVTTRASLEIGELILTRLVSGPARRTAYRTVTAVGAVEAFGNAGPCPSFTERRLANPSAPPMVAVAPGASVDGFLLASADGGVFTSGDASFRGSRSGRPLNAPIVGMAADPDGDGYWLVAADGGVFSFDAPFLGSRGGRPLNAPIVGMAASRRGRGYHLVAADGGVFSFGGATFAGSTGARRLEHPMVGMAADPDGTGYWLAAADGGVFSFAAPFLGSLGARPPATPVVGIAPAA